MSPSPALYSEMSERKNGQAGSSCSETKRSGGGSLKVPSAKAAPIRGTSY